MKPKLTRRQTMAVVLGNTMMTIATAVVAFLFYRGMSSTETLVAVLVYLLFATGWLSIIFSTYGARLRP